MAQSQYARYLVTEPLRELGAPPAPPVANRQDSSMTFMSNDLVPGSNVYVEFSWVYGIPDPNPHILEHVHEDYNEIVVHIGSDPNNPHDLGGELELSMEGEPLVINKTSALYVPRGMKHGPIIWKKFSRPHLQMSIVLGAGTLAQATPGGY